MSAVGVTNSKLADQRFVIFGAGSAGLGIARQLRDGIVAIDGVDRATANRKFYLLDKHGLIKQSLGPENIREGIAEFVRPDAEWPEATGEVELLEVVRRVRPTVLIGCSTRAGAFSEDVVRAMAKGTPRPIILPLSNPSRLHEVTPQDAMDWTDGKALLATGSPFPPCRLPGGKEYMCVIVTLAVFGCTYIFPAQRCLRLRYRKAPCCALPSDGVFPSKFRWTRTALALALLLGRLALRYRGRG